MYSKNDTIVLTGSQANEVQSIIQSQKYEIEKLKRLLKEQQQQTVNSQWDKLELEAEYKKVCKERDTYKVELRKSRESEKLMTRAYIQKKDELELSEFKRDIRIVNITKTVINEKTKPSEKKVSKSIKKFDSFWA